MSAVFISPLINDSITISVKIIVNFIEHCLFATFDHCIELELIEIHVADFISRKASMQPFPRLYTKKF